jgi:hypothetical protein
VPSQQPLPSQFDLLPEFAIGPSSLAPTDGNTITELDLIFYALPGAGAVVREVDAGKGSGAEVVRALC